MTATVLHLPTARSLATVDVARLTDSRTYARGAEYLRAGRVVLADRSAHVVTATVSGTTPYAVHLAVGRHGVEHRCTCPIGTEGGFCKHLVAVAIAASSVELDDGDRLDDDVRSWLAPLGRDELVELLAELTDGDPALRRRLGRRLATTGRPADLAAYRRAIEDDSDEWEARAHEVIDAVEELLAGPRAGEVADFCQRAVELLGDNAAEIRDDAAVRRLGARLADLHRGASRSTAHPDPPPRWA